jgi:hypothetical protein
LASCSENNERPGPKSREVRRRLRQRTARRTTAAAQSRATSWEAGGAASNSGSLRATLARRNPEGVLHPTKFELEGIYGICGGTIRASIAPHV